MMKTQTVNVIMESIRSGYTDHNGVTHRANNQIPVIIALQAHLDMPLKDICALKVENISHDGKSWIIKTDTHSQAISDRLKAFIDAWTRSKGINDGSLFSISEQTVYKHLRAVSGYLEIDPVSAESIRDIARMRSCKERRHNS